MCAIVFADDAHDTHDRGRTRESVLAAREATWGAAVEDWRQDIREYKRGNIGE